jgi:HSP20 family protein
MASRKDNQKKSAAQKRTSGQQAATGQQGSIGQQGRGRAQPDRSTAGTRGGGQMSEDSGRPQSWEGRSEWAGTEQTGQWGQERNERGTTSGRPSDQRRIGEDAWSEGRTQQRGARDETRQRQAALSRGALQHWSPFQDLGRAFGLGSWLSHPLFSRGLSSFEEFMPSTDVYLDGDNLMVKADLPGMSRDDVDVRIDNGDLVVSGERRHESEVDERNMYRSERAYGSFYRRVPLPQGADAEHVQARFRDGVLEVKVPLREQAAENTRRIEIR